MLAKSASDPMLGYEGAQRFQVVGYLDLPKAYLPSNVHLTYLGKVGLLSH
jgi:hypothetical protein